MAKTVITRSGLFVDVTNPQMDTIEIEDIAHHLAMTCRWNGATPSFYSVAEHSVLIAEWLMEKYPEDDEAHKLAMLHDAPEFVLGDMVRPVKVLFIDRYLPMDSKIMGVISNKYLSYPTTQSITRVFDADDRITVDERNKFWPGVGSEWTVQGEPLGVDIKFDPPMVAKKRYLDLWEKLQ